MISEQIQFAISQYLDGTLPEGERAALEARLAADAELRRVLEEYRALHEALRGSMVLPAVKWEKLAERISASVEQLAANPIDEQTEYAIAQYVDGQLPEGERAALEKRLESDPAARMAMEEYRSLQRVTERAWSLPRVDWQRLSERISDAVAEAAQRARYSIAWVRRPMQLAMAASVLIVLGLAVAVLTRGGKTGEGEARYAQVTGPAMEQATGPAVAEIHIGAMDDTARNSYATAAVVGLSAPRMHISVARGPEVVQESGLFQQ